MADTTLPEAPDDERDAVRQLWNRGRTRRSVRALLVDPVVRDVREVRLPTAPDDDDEIDREALGELLGSDDPTDLDLDSGDAVLVDDRQDEPRADVWYWRATDEDDGGPIRGVGVIARRENGRLTDTQLSVEEARQAISFSDGPKAVSAPLPVPVG